MGDARRGRLWFVIDSIEVLQDGEPEVRLWLALPVEHRGQRVRIGAIRPEPVEVIEDPLDGNRIAFWQVGDVHTGEKLTFTVDFEIEVTEVTTEVDPARVEPYDTQSEECRRYTVSERWAEITREIEAVAKEVAAGEKDPWLAARRLFDWVVENMTYEYPAMEDRGSARSLEKRKGDCGEFSVVFLTMCRALGIPARSVICNWFQGSGHAWAEILIPPYGWIPVDTSVADLLVNEGSELGGDAGADAFREMSGLTSEDPAWLFGNLYPNRIIVFVGNNMEVTSRKTGISRTFLFLQPGGTASLPPSIETDGIAESAAHCVFYLFDDDARDESAATRRAEMEMAGAYYQAKDYERAEPALRRVVEEKPTDALSWLYLGLIYLDWKEYGRGEAAFRSSLAGAAGSITPVLHAWARIGLGNCLDATDRRTEAIAEYQAVLDSGVDFQGSADAARKHLEEPYSPE